MAEYTYITEEMLQWFLPLLPDSEQKALREDPQVYGIGAIVDSVACGAMVIESFGDENVQQIRYLIVGDDYRRQRIGTGMMEYLCEDLYEDATLLLGVFGASGDEDPVYRFFDSMWNFTIAEDEGYYCRVPLAELKKNKKLASMKGKGRRPVPFFSLSDREQRSFYNKLLELDVPYLQDIPEGDFAKELCMCCKKDSGAVTAAVFLTKEKEGSDLELACAWGAQGGEMDLVGLLAHVSSLIADSEEGYLNIAAVDENSVSLVE